MSSFTLQDVYPFFHEFRVTTPSKNGFQVVCYTATLFTTEAIASGLTLIGVLLTLAAGEGQWAMFYLVMEACKSRLLGQRTLNCEPLLLQLLVNITCSSHDHHSK
jgi:hypothetical protein